MDLQHATSNKKAKGKKAKAKTKTDEGRVS
jgi:hypothetical protein